MEKDDSILGLISRIRGLSEETGKMLEERNKPCGFDFLVDATLSVKIGRHFPTQPQLG